VPEGVLWDVSAEQPPETPATPETVQGQAAAEAGDSVADAANGITKNLALLIRSALEEVDRDRAGRIATMEAGIASLARITEGIAPLREGLAALLPQVASLGDVQPLLQTRLAALETAVGAQAENQSEHAGQLRSLSAIQEDVCRKLEDQVKIIADLAEQGRQLQQSLQAQQDALNERVENLGGSLRAEAASQLSGACTQLQQGQEELQKRLGAQAEAIRALHSVAQNRVARREDLQAAVQKLEEIAGALDQVNPLPKEL
jgi:chromosome segregation ATPase